MPKQYSFCGHLLPRLSIRRMVLMLTFVSVFAFCLTFVLSSGVPTSPSLAVVPKISVNQISQSLSKSSLNPFGQPAHSPPRQKNDQFIGSAWWADWKWLVPFSNSMTTKDDDRAILPYLRQRQPVYCYYDATVKKTKEEKDAESELLLIWRRAWWSNGFNPMILGPADAMGSPLYAELQKKSIDPDFHADALRWLAWEAMDGGILSQHTVFPMGVEFKVMPYLRRGQFQGLRRWENLGDAIFSGNKEDVNGAIKKMMESNKLQSSQAVLSVLPDDMFVIDKLSSVFAHYSLNTVKKKYPKVVSTDGKKIKGKELNQLINAHLQIAWQSSFPEGIEVVKPFPEHMTAVISKGYDLAKSLQGCAPTPMPGSCPPNLANCAPCGATTPMKVTTPGQFHNKTSVFTIGIVPHPWTFTVLSNMRDDFNVTWIREEAPRDAWLTEVTLAAFGAGVTTNRRIVNFKQILAGEKTSFHSLWLSAERDFPTDLDWHFGFAIPKEVADDGKSKSPVPGDRIPKKEKLDKLNGPVASEDGVRSEMDLLARAKEIISLTKASDRTKLRGSLEAWNLAHLEVWRFTRAMQARRQLERSSWEKEQQKFSQGAGSERGRTSWNRWGDQKEDHEAIKSEKGEKGEKKEKQ